MNSKAVADAIAARFAGVSATVGTTIESPAIGPTASLPDAIGKSALLVYPPTGVLGIGVSKLRDDELTFPVRLLRDPLSMKARSDWLYAWYDAMRDQVEKDMDLGLAYVAWARSAAVRVEIDGTEYWNAQGVFAPFDVVELLVHVRFNEVVTTVSP